MRTMQHEILINNQMKVRKNMEYKDLIQNQIKDLESYANGQIKYNNVDPFDDEMIDVKNQIDILQKLLNESEEA